VEPPTARRTKRSNLGGVVVEHIDDGDIVTRGDRGVQRRIVVESKIVAKPNERNSHGNS
jgi:hypothetical protein